MGIFLHCLFAFVRDYSLVFPLVGPGHGAAWSGPDGGVDPGDGSQRARTHLGDLRRASETSDARQRLQSAQHVAPLTPHGILGCVDVDVDCDYINILCKLLRHTAAAAAAVVFAKHCSESWRGKLQHLERLIKYSFFYFKSFIDFSSGASGRMFESFFTMFCSAAAGDAFFQERFAAVWSTGWFICWGN